MYGAAPARSAIARFFVGKCSVPNAFGSLMPRVRWRSWQAPPSRHGNVVALHRGAAAPAIDAARLPLSPVGSGDAGASTYRIRRSRIDTVDSRSGLFAPEAKSVGACGA